MNRLRDIAYRGSPSRSAPHLPADSRPAPCNSSAGDRHRHRDIRCCGRCRRRRHVSARWPDVLAAGAGSCGEQEQQAGGRDRAARRRAALFRGVWAATSVAHGVSVMPCRWQCSPGHYRTWRPVPALRLPPVGSDQLDQTLSASVTRRLPGFPPSLPLATRSVSLSHRSAGRIPAGGL